MKRLVLFSLVFLNALAGAQAQNRCAEAVSDPTRIEIADETKDISDVKENEVSAEELERETRFSDTEARRALRLPRGYEQLRADEKLDVLWSKIERTSYGKDNLPAAYSWSQVWGYLRAFFTLGKAFDRPSDLMRKDRPKFIHSVGSVAKIKLVPVANTPYSGLLKSGAEGVLRLSTAIPASSGNFLPGAALKLLVDGHESVNLHLMPSLDGQGKNHNYFNQDISNRLPKSNNAAIKLLAAYFRRVRDPFYLPVDQLGSVTARGEVVADNHSPEQIILRPTAESHALIAPNSKNDFRVDLATVPTGTVLWDLYAKDSVDGPEFLIGQIVSTSEFRASLVGDRLAFRHQGGPKK